MDFAFACRDRKKGTDQGYLFKFLRQMGFFHFRTGRRGTPDFGGGGAPVGGGGGEGAGTALEVAPTGLLFNTGVPASFLCGRAPATPLIGGSGTAACPGFPMTCGRACTGGGGCACCCCCRARSKPLRLTFPPMPCPTLPSRLSPCPSKPFPAIPSGAAPAAPPPLGSPISGFFSFREGFTAAFFLLPPRRRRT